LSLARYTCLPTSTIVAAIPEIAIKALRALAIHEEDLLMLSISTVITTEL
jgi:hypothetical protein